MKIRANRYGKIESFELIFALQADVEQRLHREQGALRRAAWREQWRERGQQGMQAAATLAAGLRAALARTSL